MRFSSFQIKNYKSFYASPEVSLTSGFNVIVGQNNAGKTALVEALALRFDHKPHRSLDTVEAPGAVLRNQQSSVTFSIHLGEGELLDLLRKHAPDFYIRIDQDSQPPLFHSGRFLQLLHTENFLKCTYRPDGFIEAYLVAYGNPNDDNPSLHYRFKELDPEPTLLSNDSVGSGNTRPMPYLLAELLRDRLYFFNAQRLNISEHQVSDEPVLLPSAANLPQVLNLLRSGNPPRFQVLEQCVRIVLPEITQITAPPVRGATAQIRVWTIDPDSQREDLAMPLSESGTGIGQVLAILYIVVTSDYPRVIIIDEPQSFLHPGAVRKLFELLRQQFPQHQYIITTHSPTAVTSADPQTLLIVRKKGAESTLEAVATQEAESLRSYLLEIGARLSDVFGADKILWVEGRTEERCFPLIVQNLLNQPLLGTAIIGVPETSDFDKKNSDILARIYERLCKGPGLIPPSIGFILDRESRSEELVAKLQGQGISFLGRAMYENYLLNPDAIAAVLSKELGDTKIVSDDVDKWLKEHKWDEKYVKLKHGSEESEVEWLRKVHGKKLLDGVFWELSVKRLRYEGNEVYFGHAITTTLIENAPSDLDEIVELIRTVLL